MTSNKPTDLDTLKAWCHWKKMEIGLSEADYLFVRAIEDVISQVGSWKAKCEKLIGGHTPEEESTGAMTISLEPNVKLRIGEVAVYLVPSPGGREGQIKWPKTTKIRVAAPKHMRIHREPMAPVQWSHKDRDKKD